MSLITVLTRVLLAKTPCLKTRFSKANLRSVLEAFTILKSSNLVSRPMLTLLFAPLPLPVQIQLAPEHTDQLRACYWPAAGQILSSLL